MFFVQFLFCQTKIAVLPFENVNSDIQYNWLSKGFSETLTSAYAQMGSFIVVERSQIEKIIKEQDFQISDYTDKDKIVNVGKLLGVEKIVIGSYQIFGGNIKVNSRVLDVETGEIDEKGVVTKTDKLDNIFYLQDEICRIQATSFGITISSDDQIKIDAVTLKSTTSLSAYEFYIKGRDCYIEGYDKYEQAVECFLKATEIDNNYALAFAGLGNLFSRTCRLREVYQNKKEYNLSITLADEFSKKAVELNPNLAEAYISRALFYREKNDRDNMLLMLKSALNIDKNNFEIYVLLGDAYSFSELIPKLYKDIYYESAINYYKKSISLNSNFALAYNNCANIYMNVDSKYYNIDEALNLYKKAISVEPNNLKALHNLGTTYIQLNDYDNALYYFQQLVVLDPEYSEVYYYMALIYKEKRMISKAIDMISKYKNSGINYSEKRKADKLLKELKGDR